VVDLARVGTRRDGSPSLPGGGGFTTTVVEPRFLLDDWFRFTGLEPRLIYTVYYSL
jgi:hypothetical protein